eukprot:scaffold1810_cov60-Cyclotella_meneghiniana.AAC.17
MIRLPLVIFLATFCFIERKQAIFDILSFSFLPVYQAHLSAWLKTLLPVLEARREFHISDRDRLGGRLRDHLRRDARACIVLFLEEDACLEGLDPDDTVSTIWAGRGRGP